MSIIKYENFNEEYILNGEGIDQIAAKAEEFLYSLEMERANVLGIRLSLEEALLRWYDHFRKKGEEPRVEFFAGKRFFRPYMEISLKGDSIDPLDPSDPDTDTGDWVANVMENIGLSPRYAYFRGVNTISLRLNPPHRNPGIGLLVGILAGLIIGFLGKVILTEAMLEGITTYFFDPVENVFFRLLKATAGPVIFFTVLTAICGIGSAAMMNKSGKRMIGRFIFFSTLMTLIYAVLGTLIMRPDFMTSPILRTGYSVFETLLDFLPGDIISPFLNTDSPQLIMLAIIIGNALLILGSQGSRLVKIANQANSVGLLVANWISRIIPYFVALLIAMRILDGTYVRFIGIWIPLLLFHLFIVAALVFALYITSRKYGVSISSLWAKIKPSFMIAFKNASVDSAFGENRLCCERKLGINGKLADFGLPLGLVIYMPSSTVSLMASTLFAAKCYNITITTLWLILAMILVVALQAASPPVSGVDTLAYAAIFARLGIPSEALIMAIICDIIFCFISSAVNQAMLQLELIHEADRLNMLNKDVLKKPI
ncbi:MAG: cation:dicarboxylase symporter family transporter [Firmicutes bacterium]|nr:cation:dicarboxylase symporter family transporter [Bacillota bacterium]